MSEIGGNKALTDAMAVVMSDISEECYCASWLTGLEYSLWSVIEHGRPFGMCDYGQMEQRIESLRALRELTGCWVVWNEGEGDDLLPVTVEAFRTMFEASPLAVVLEGESR